MPLNIAELKKVFRDFDSGVELEAETGSSVQCVDLLHFCLKKN